MSEHAHKKLLIDTSYVYREGRDIGTRVLLDAEGHKIAAIFEPRDGQLSVRIAACFNAFAGVTTEDIEALGSVGEAFERGLGAAVAGEKQWMQIAALLMHRFALSGETIVFSTDEMRKMDERYPEGADLRAEDADGGAIAVTLLPPGEEPSGIILPQSGPGRIIAS